MRDLGRSDAGAGAGVSVELAAGDRWGAGDCREGGGRGAGGVWVGRVAVTAHSLRRSDWAAMTLQFESNLVGWSCGVELNRLGARLLPGAWPRSVASVAMRHWRRRDVGNLGQF